MTRRIYGLLGAAAIAAFGAACKEDPLADTGGTLTRLDLEYAYREVIIGDSVRTFVIERDALNTPLPPTATVRSCNAAVATVTPVSDTPLQRTGFFVKALTFGATCVVAEAGALADTMQVSTFPASIAITAGPDSIQSGAVTMFGYQYRDRTGNAVTGVPAPTFSTSDTLIGKALPAPVGSITGRTPGLFTLTVTGTGSPPGGVVASKGVTVIPGTFTGTISPGSGGSADRITFTRAAGGPAFDNDTQIAFGTGFTLTSFTDQVRVTADAIDAAAPVAAATGSIPFVLTNIGPNQVALAGTFTISRTDLADPYDAVNDDPSTAPDIAVNGAYFIVMSGTCPGGVGIDCDDFFTITNNLTRPDTISVNVQWVGAPSSGADIDVLWCNAACSAIVGNFDGATVANPEASTVIIPASTTWRLWINLFDPHGTTHSLARVRVTGKG
ncbi:MAG TPA: hypothetical protein VGQ06_01110 [Gemmatimonadales bacterium]|jgi:hypothetical protein|nr:hypothetical protein [Gemmatimonadales bacterium]